MIGRIVSHYRVTRELGAGGMGVVYEAVDTKLDRTVALKFLPTESTRNHQAKARFVREAKAASALDHPNVCTVFEIDETEDGQMFLAMARYEGETLKERIAKGPLPIDEALGITRQIAEGLAKAHEQEIVHRDIKPANIFVTTDGLVKILDFGLAKLAGQTKMTRTGITLGTVSYMSPEQARTEEADHRTDLWSLGIVLYEMVTGRLPFQKEQEQTTLYAILNEMPDPVTALRTGVPMEVESLIDRCLEKDAGMRYQTAGDLAADLRRAEQRTDSSLPPTKAIVRPSRSPRHWPWVTAAGLVAVVLLALLVVPWIFNQGGVPSDDEQIMLAVLPFANLGDPDDAYFADGITDEILTKLSAVADLGVIARESSFRFRGDDYTISEIGERLGVDYVLKGSIRWQHSADGASSIRVTPRLVSVAENRDVWASAFEEELDQVFAVQASIGRSVVEALNRKLGDSGRSAMDEKPTDDLVAYEHYLRAKDLYYQSNKKSTLEAIESLLEQAIDRDPEFAQAHALAGINHANMYHYSVDRSVERLERARLTLTEALAIDPDLPEAHFAWGVYQYIAKRNYAEALRSFEKVRDRRPNDLDALHWTGVVKKRQGRFEEALGWYRRALQVNPGSRRSMVEEAIVLQWVDAEVEAAEKFRRIISLWPDEPHTYVYLSALYRGLDGNTQRARPLLEEAMARIESNRLILEWLQILVLEGQFEEALRILAEVSDLHDDRLEKHRIRSELYHYLGREDLMRASADSARIQLEQRVNADPEDPVWHRELGLMYAYLGRRSDAVREAQRSVSLMPISRDAVAGPVYAHTLAQVYLLVGEQDSAIDQLAILLASRSRFLSIPELRNHPFWAPLRDHLRFQELIAGGP